MKETKINIGIALSRNYDKISIEFLDEAISHETDEELRELIKTKFKFLKECVLNEFEEKPQTKTTIPLNEALKPSAKQIKFLGDLGFKGKTDNLSKEEARILITELLNKSNGEDY